MVRDRGACSCIVQSGGAWPAHNRYSPCLFSPATGQQQQDSPPHLELHRWWGSSVSTMHVEADNKPPGPLHPPPLGTANPRSASRFDIPPRPLQALHHPSLFSAHPRPWIRAPGLPPPARLGNHRPPQLLLLTPVHPPSRPFPSTRSAVTLILRDWPRLHL